MSRSTLFGSGPEVDRKWTGVFRVQTPKTDAPVHLAHLNHFFPYSPHIFNVFGSVFIHLLFFSIATI